MEREIVAADEYGDMEAILRTRVHPGPGHTRVPGIPGPGSCAQPMLRNNASGPEIGLPGRLATSVCAINAHRNPMDL